MWFLFSLFLSIYFYFFLSHFPSLSCCLSYLFLSFPFSTYTSTSHFCCFLSLSLDLFRLLSVYLNASQWQFRSCWLSFDGVLMNHLLDATQNPFLTRQRVISVSCKLIHPARWFSFEIRPARQVQILTNWKGRHLSSCFLIEMIRVNMQNYRKENINLTWLEHCSNFDAQSV